VALPVTGKTISGQVCRRHGVAVFNGHRLALTGSRSDIRSLSRRGNPDFPCSKAWR
jgi:hypothetical protein